MAQQKVSTREYIIEQEIGAMYDFFERAEQTGEHFTYKKLCEVYPRGISTVRWYVKNYWSWFLVQESKSRPFTFSCHNLTRYPRQYFIDAHKPNKGQYFHHFVLAMQEGIVHAEEERRKRAEAKARTQQVQLPVIGDEQETTIAQQEATALVPEQELPDIHIENIGDEIEDGENNGGSLLVAGVFIPPLVDELPVEEEDSERVNHHAADNASEAVEVVSPVAIVSGEELQSPPDKRQQEGEKRFSTKTLVAAAVCLVIVVGLTIWWVVSKK